MSNTGEEGQIETEGKDSLDLLSNKGHTVVPSPAIGTTQSILIEEGRLHGSSDPRRPGGLADGH